MSSARDEVLGRVRQATGTPSIDRAKDYESIERSYRQRGEGHSTATLALLTDRLRDYGSGVFCCSTVTIRSALQEILESRTQRRLLVADVVPRDWLPSGFDFVHDMSLGYPEIDSMDGVLTLSVLAIASTGTIVLRHSAENGRRALTLIPDYHLCVILEDQIVETVPEGIRRMATLPSGPLTTISGPSATSDIEMTRVKGVHGPRSMDVLIVQT